jgi:hypothetical protein
LPLYALATNLGESAFRLQDMDAWQPGQARLSSRACRRSGRSLP